MPVHFHWNYKAGECRYSGQSIPVLKGPERKFPAHGNGYPKATNQNRTCHIIFDARESQDEVPHPGQVSSIARNDPTTSCRYLKLR